MLVIIRGAGDIASGIALRLYNSGIKIIMTEIPLPTSIRRTVCFSEAVYCGETKVEGVTAVLCADAFEAVKCTEIGKIAVLADENGNILKQLYAECVVDARLAKRNIDTSIDDAPIVIGVGPGFTAGKDCHAVIETKRGHYLGRVIYEGSAQENTGIPGNISGFTVERLLTAPRDGVITRVLPIGTQVKQGDVCGYVEDVPIKARIDGVLRGMLREGTCVYKGMKSGDIDPRSDVEYCNFVSDKALAVGGGVLEAIGCFLSKR